ncbi:MAG: hypothetical protein JWR15_730 [Prosthecobacter sp.]|nr:hypothetical protein [Prosthecobacter sp.]
MKHKAHSDFWFHYRQLPARIQTLADKNFELLRDNPRHPSIQLKKVASDIYSARVGLNLRSLAFDFGEHLVWFWIGPHDEYDRLLSAF